MMRVSEIYTSVQGEGPRVGQPTVFTRFGGCNLRCPGWPCDTEHAINVAYRNEWAAYTAPQLSFEVTAMHPQNICLTGGEPYLQKAADLEQFVKALTVHGKSVEAFTNGTLPYDDWWVYLVDLVMDWKLPGSGEGDAGIEHRLKNINLMTKSLLSGRNHSVKFVIADRSDYEIAKNIWNNWLAHCGLNVYYGVVWGKLENATLISWVLEDRLPWLLNIQTHNYVWDRSQRGI